MHEMKMRMLKYRHGLAEVENTGVEISSLPCIEFIGIGAESTLGGRTFLSEKYVGL